MSRLNLLLTFVFLGGLGCQRSQPVLYLVTLPGDGGVTLEEFETRLKEVSRDFPEYLSAPGGKRRILEILTAEKLVLYEAKKLGVNNQPALRQKVEERRQLLKRETQRLLLREENRLLLEKMMEVRVAVSEAEARVYYEAHREEFQKPQEIRVAHILVNTLEEAEAILERVKKKQRFEKIAREVSLDRQSAVKGGDMGFIARRQLLPEFEKAAFELKARGSVSSSVRTELGWHVIQLLDRRAARPISFEDAFPSIRDLLYKQKLETYFDELRRKHPTHVNETLFSRLDAQAPRVPQVIVSTSARAEEVVK